MITVLEMRFWITLMNITMTAWVTAPALTVQHMKNTDSAFKEQYRTGY